MKTKLDPTPLLDVDKMVDAELSGKAQMFGASPALLLAMFTSLSFFIYFDRGVYGSLIDVTRTAFHMSQTEAGVCSSAYLVCYCLACPVFAQVSRYLPPLRLSSIGMAVWVIAVVGCGLSQNFWTLLLARALTGFGEASFLVVAAPLIDFIAPKTLRSLWLSIFYAAIPIGYAGGAAVAGIISNDKDLFNSHWRWRSVYLLEAIAVCPLIAAFLLLRGPPSMEHVGKVTFSAEESSDEQSGNPATCERSRVSGIRDDASSSQKTGGVSGVLILDDSVATGSASENLEYRPSIPPSPPDSRFSQLKDDLRALLKNRLYISIVLGYAMQTFFVGGVAVFGIDYIHKEYPFSKKTASMIFGGMTAVTGLFGSAAGGYILDLTKPKPPLPAKFQVALPEDGDVEAVTFSPDPAAFGPGYMIEMILASCRVMWWCSIIAAPPAIAAFSMNMKYPFLAMLFVGELAAFMMIGPINSAIVWCVPIALQPTAVAVNTLAIHLLGDALSPIVIGALTDSIDRRFAMLLSACSLLLPVVFFGISWFLCKVAIAKGPQHIGVYLSD